MQAGKSTVRFLLMLLWVMLSSAGAIMPTALAAGKKAISPPAPSLALSSYEYEADALLIKYKASVSDFDARISAEKHGARTVTHLKSHSKLPKRAGEQWRHVKFRQGEDLQQAMARFLQDPDVEYVEPNYIVTISAVPNDPRFGELWGMNNTGQTGGIANADINAPEAWDMQTGTGDVVVAVIDTGVDYNHPDLAANIWTNPGEIPDNGIDDDGNGYIDDVHGYDFANTDGNPMDDHAHGTHVSGTIAAVGNNGIGIAGVNWRAKIMALKFLDASGSGTSSNAILAINYATQMGAKISSNSWGGGSSSLAMYDAIQAAGNAGALFVAAAGNSGCNCLMYPAAYDLPNIISVAATDHNDALATFSNYDAVAVDLGAPGVSILSTVPSGSCTYCDPSGYRLFSGTSMATPHVAGAAALLKSVSSGLTWQQIKDHILTTVDPIPALAGKTLTGGRLNLQRLVNLSYALAIDPVNQSVLAGNSVAYTVSVSSLNNASGTVNLSLDIPDSGISAVFASPSVTLAPGGTVTTMLTLTASLSMATGYYHLTLRTVNQQGVSNALNFDLAVTPDVDLQVSAVSTATASVPSGAPLTINSTVTNLGSVAATANSSVGLYLSTDPVITARDQYLGSWSLPSLAPGASASADTVVNFSRLTTEGTYYIGAIADYNNTQLETNEGNNALVGAGVNVTAGFDLVPLAVSATPLTVGMEENLTITDTVKNIGALSAFTGVDAANPIIYYYLSPDPIFDWLSDIRFGSRMGAKLAAGASETQTNTFIAPSLNKENGYNGTLVQPGTYYLITYVNYFYRQQPESNLANNIFVGPQINLVRDFDLTPSSATTTATNLPIGGTIPVTVTVRNLGTTTSFEGGTITYNLSSDPASLIGNFGYANIPLPKIAGGGEYTFTQNVSVSTLAVAGNTYYLHVTVNGGSIDVNPGNNSLAGAFALTAVRDVDLTFSSVNTSATSAAAGNPMPVTAVLSNLGTTPAYSTTGFAFYLSSDAVITTDDIRIGNVLKIENLPGYRDGLPGGASAAIDMALNIPSSIVPGPYYVGAIADSGNSQPETNENNNAATGNTVQVTSSLDLAMVAVGTAASSVASGTSFTLSNTMQNLGGGTVSDALVNLYLSTDATITTSDTLIGTRTLANLASGSSDSANTTVTVPATVAPGTYYIGAIVDPNNALGETNESNNVLAGTAIAVVRDVDLVVTGVSTLATSVLTGGSFTVDDTVENQGLTPAAPAAGFTVNYYLSGDATITAADTLVGSRTVATLGSGASNAASTAVAVPANLAAGTYYLGAIVDAGNVQPETNETNNARAGVTVVVVRDVDYVVTSLLVSGSSTVPAGGTFQVKSTVKNQGTAAGSGTWVYEGVYLSSDATVTTSDTRLTGFNFSISSSMSPLAAGASVTSRWTWVTVPAGLTPGTYYLGAVADITGTEAESNEANNSLVWGTITVTP